MTQLASPSASIDAATGDLVLQIRGTNRHGQIVRLRSAKCAIGSGPSCTLRIVARGVRPVQCLILRGRSATVVRRWCSDVRLNGQDFVDVRLTPGDVLTIGPVGLEIVQCPAPAGQAAGEISEVPALGSDAEPQGPEAELCQLEDQPAGGDAGEGAAEGASGDTPLTTVDLLRRLGTAESLVGEIEKSEREASSPRAEYPRPGPAASPRPPTEEEETIDDYMSRLLARVRSVGSDPGSPAPVAAEASEPSATTKAEGLPEREVALPGPPDPPSFLSSRPRQVGPIQLAPRAAVPEKLGDLSAMRELANLSAQAALSRHHRRTLVSLSTGKLIVAATALACGVWLLGTWWFSKSRVALYGGGLALVAALLWSIQYAIVTNRILGSRSGHLQRLSLAKCEIDEKPADPPHQAPEVKDEAPQATAGE